MHGSTKQKSCVCLDVNLGRATFLARRVDTFETALFIQGTGDNWKELCAIAYKHIHWGASFTA